LTAASVTNMLKADLAIIRTVPTLWMAQQHSKGKFENDSWSIEDWDQHVAKMPHVAMLVLFDTYWDYVASEGPLSPDDYKEIQNLYVDYAGKSSMNWHPVTVPISDDTMVSDLLSSLVS